MSNNTARELAAIAAASKVEVTKVPTGASKKAEDKKAAARTRRASKRVTKAKPSTKPSTKRVTKAKPSTKPTSKAKVNVLTTVDIAKEINMSPKAARAKIRRHAVSIKSSWRASKDANHEWKATSKDALVELLTTDQRKS